MHNASTLHRRHLVPILFIIVLILFLLTHHRQPRWWETGSQSPAQTVDQSRLFEAAWPANIWQTGSEEMTKTWKDQVQTWQNLNPGWTYHFLGDDACNEYVDKHFSRQPTIHSFWHQLNSTILKADMIRYLVMLAEGGVYSDMDTSCLKPVVDWIPTEYEEMDIRVVAGIEYDDNTYPMFARPISLSQWTLMGKPGHPVFHKVVARVIYHLEYLARIKHVELNALKLDKKEVLDATGPGAYTDSIMEVISEHEGRRIEWKELSQLKEPRLYGDVLILPINAFGGGQKHSHSGGKEFGPKLIQHHFGRRWYKRPADKKEAAKPEVKKKPAEPEIEKHEDRLEVKKPKAKLRHK